MKNFIQPRFMCALLAVILCYLSGCSDDDAGPQLTGESKTFVLMPVSNAAISGTVTFAERDDDQVFISIVLVGTQAGNTHPSHIHGNSAAEGGTILLDLTDVDGASGKSETVVNALNDGTPITYDELLAFDGYVNVHSSTSDMGTLIAQGDIGQNGLTGESKTYPLASASDPAISGEVTFAERVNGNALVTIQLVGTTAGGDHPAHIHANNVTTGGPIILDLKNVNGASGRSATDVSALKNGTAITYDGLLTLNGWVQVHLSSGSLGTILAKGDIGSNAP
jgi:hypothetical protein